MSRQASQSWKMFPDTSRFFFTYYFLRMVYLCYIDESGTPHIPGNTSHYVLCGISIPIKYWKICDVKINKIKSKYQLKEAEIHTGWIIRKYIEQTKIPNFDSLSYADRRCEVLKLRKAEIFKLQKGNDPKAYKQVRKNYKQTDAYIHLTYQERIKFIQEIADEIGSWTYIRIFAECIDKIHFDPTKSKQSVDEQALEQIVSRFELYMSNVAKTKNGESIYGLLIHDNNETVSKKHTHLMQKFHKRGTLWTKIDHIIETPLFVNSELTSMVQIADLCALALRRYLENNETDLYNRISSRFDRRKGQIVGVRHFTSPNCTCLLCNKE